MNTSVRFTPEKRSSPTVIPGLARVQRRANLRYHLIDHVFDNALTRASAQVMALYTAFERRMEQMGGYDIRVVFLGTRHAKKKPAATPPAQAQKKNPCRRLH